MFPIDKNIAIPGHITKPSSYPFGDMALNDSFLVPREQSKAARAAAVHYARRKGVKFVSRKVEGGIRIWRTA